LAAGAVIYATPRYSARCTGYDTMFPAHRGNIIHRPRPAGIGLHAVKAGGTGHRLISEAGAFSWVGLSW